MNLLQENEYSKLGKYHLNRKPEYSKFDSHSVYIEMSDKVKIAADFIVPMSDNPKETFPVLLHQTRYWRAAYSKTLNV